MSDIAPNAHGIHFAHMREDPEHEIKLATLLAEDKGRPVRVLTVASGGCTSMSLLAHEGVAHVDAVDINPAQLHLVALRQAASSTLSRDEYLALLGETDADDRAALFERTRAVLPGAAASFFDARPELVAAGAATVGTFDRMLDEVREQLAASGLAPLDRPAEALGHASWRAIFERVFERARLRALIGSAMETYSTTYGFAAHFSLRFATALRSVALSPVEKASYHLNHIFGRGLDKEMAPPYLTEVGYAALQEQDTSRMSLHNGNFLGRMQALVAEGGKFDLISFSDVTDWMPTREVQTLFRAAQSCVVEGGAVLARRLNGDYRLADMMRRYFTVDSALSRQMHGRDATFLYNEVVAAYA